MSRKSPSFHFAKYGFGTALLYSLILFLIFFIHNHISNNNGMPLFSDFIGTFSIFFFFIMIFLVPIAGLLITASQQLAVNIFHKIGLLPFKGEDKKIGYMYGLLVYAISVLILPAFLTFTVLVAYISSFFFPENIKQATSEVGIGYAVLYYFLVTLPSLPLIFIFGPKALKEYSEIKYTS